MGHHHRKNRIQSETQPKMSQDLNTNPLANIDLSSMLGNLNLDNIDLSKIDMNKVQSIMDKIKLPENTSEGTPGNLKNGTDSRINFLNSLKSMLPTRRAKTMDSVTKFIQIAQLMNVNTRRSSNR
jgi:hypothetical protein